MTKSQALYAFFSGFGIPAYERSRVPESATYPYLTYDYKDAELGELPVALTVDIYYITESNDEPDAKAAAMAAAVGRGGVTLPCDCGCIWLKRGSPFCQALRDPIDRRINRRYINITAEFLTV